MVSFTTSFPRKYSRATATVFAALLFSGPMFFAQPAEAQLLKSLIKDLSKGSEKKETEKKDDKPNVTNNLSDNNGGSDDLEAVALVEEISGASNANVEAFDTVARGQKINLGRSGKMTLSYSTSCLVEKVSGGLVEVAMNAKTGGSIVRSGRLSDNGAACQKENAQKLAALLASSKEGAVVVPRLETPFANSDWTEKTVATRLPSFAWPKRGGGTFQVAILDLDHPTAPKVMWKTRTKRNLIRYPGTGKKFRLGMPYALQVTYPDGTIRRAGFNVDPGLQATRNLAGRTVFIAKARK